MIRELNKNAAKKLRVYLMAAAVLVMVGFTHWGRSHNIDDRAMVHAMGIDQDGDGLRVSLQIFKPDGPGGDTAIDTAQPNVRVMTCRGRTVGEALQEAGAKAGRELFFGHLQLICLGEELDLEDPEELFAFAVKDKNIFLGTPICTADGTAEEIMRVRSSPEETAAEAMGDLIENGISEGQVPDYRLIDVAATEESGTAAMAMLRASEEENGSSSEEGQGGSVELAGTAVIREGRLVKKLDPEQSRTCVLMAGRTERSSTAFTLGGRRYSARLTDISVSSRVYISAGRPVLERRFSLTARVPADLHSAEDSAAAAADIRDRLEADMAAAAEELIVDRGTDIFGFFTQVRHSAPALAVRYEQSPEKLLRLMQYRFIVEVDVE